LQRPRIAHAVSRLDVVIEMKANPVAVKRQALLSIRHRQWDDF
jgi:hypothetical protein